MSGPAYSASPEKNIPSLADGRSIASASRVFGVA
jgi:hypothetical protein